MIGKWCPFCLFSVSYDVREWHRDDLLDAVEEVFEEHMSEHVEEMMSVAG